ncbi:MAG TPA: PA domain-containing protein [Solirubrobacteraceae bacterium]|nr:PA domain-containing protein [Solirubrobacteraceae bacterium]
MAHDELLFSDGGTLPGFAERHVHQHGATAGHLDPTQSDSVDIVSKLSLKNVEEGKIADIGVSPNGNTAFLAAWGGQTCTKNGVHVVDISNPKAPRQTSFIPSKEGSYAGEGVQAVDISTPKFTGTILVTNNEICKDKAGFGGMNIYNVTNPKNPTPLAVGIGDTTANGQGKKAANEIHSVFAWDAGAKAYAVIVDNEEGKDVDIMDITNPKVPVLIAEYDLDETFPQIKQAAPSNLEEIFLHDMVVKEIGGKQIMMASYWDAGYVKLDVTDPKAITYLGDTDFTDPDPEAAESGLTVPPEGNGHQAEFTLDNRFVLGSDEDFAPYALKAENTTDATELTASQGSDTPRLVEGQTITGESVFAGRACAADPAVPKGDGTQIAVVERGVCAFTEKVASVEKAGGYVAVLIFNREGTDACTETLGMSVEGGIPTFGVAPRDQGFAIFNATYDQATCLAGTDGQAPIALGATGDTLTFASYFDGWGYVHLFANTDGKMAELDTYAIDEAHDPAFATGFGDLSVHEVATSKKNTNVAYLSYYSGGLRVVDISSGEIVETGHSIDEGGNNLWGVEVFDDGGTEYVAASDRDKGLYIYKYTAPTP